jgi:hypothetical protein
LLDGMGDPRILPLSKIVDARLFSTDLVDVFPIA